jgi:CRP-like cAMP-binding protein
VALLSEKRTARELFFSALTGWPSEFDNWLVDKVTSLLDEEEVDAGRRIFAEGEQVEFVYFKRDGRVELLREGSPSWILDGRSALGIFDAVLDRPHSRTAIARTPLHLAKVRAEDWLDLLEESFDLDRVAISNSVRGVAELEAQLWSLSTQARGPTIAPVVHSMAQLSFVDRVALLTDMAIVREAGVQVLVEVADLLEEMTFEAGQSLVSPGRPSGRIFLVLTGEVLATRTEGALRVTFGPGSVVCGTAALGESIAAWEAHAIEATRVLSMVVEDWFDLMEEHFDLVRSALRALALASEGLRDELAAKGAFAEATTSAA